MRHGGGRGCSISRFTGPAAPKGSGVGLGHAQRGEAMFVAVMPPRQASSGMASSSAAPAMA
ncbi:MAG: hypothetical protein U0Z44_05830 [Kouleothrix sp.]